MAELVKVASAADESEAELIQGLLQSEGVPSVVRRTAGFDVPDFLTAGPRDVLVDGEAAEVARDVLREHTPAEPSEPGAETMPASRRVLAAVLIAFALLAGTICVAAVVWL